MTILQASLQQHQMEPQLDLEACHHQQQEQNLQQQQQQPQLGVQQQQQHLQQQQQLGIQRFVQEQQQQQQQEDGVHVQEGIDGRQAAAAAGGAVVAAGSSLVRKLSTAPAGEYISSNSRHACRKGAQSAPSHAEKKAEGSCQSHGAPGGLDLPQYKSSRSPKGRTDHAVAELPWELQQNLSNVTAALERLGCSSAGGGNTRSRSSSCKGQEPGRGARVGHSCRSNHDSCTCCPCGGGDGSSAHISGCCHSPASAGTCASRGGGGDEEMLCISQSAAGRHKAAACTSSGGNVRDNGEMQDGEGMVGAPNDKVMAQQCTRLSDWTGMKMAATGKEISCGPTVADTSQQCRRGQGGRGLEGGNRLKRSPFGNKGMRMASGGKSHAEAAAAVAAAMVAQQRQQTWLGKQGGLACIEGMHADSP